MSDEDQEVFRDHFEECLVHLKVSLSTMFTKGSRESAQAKKTISEFCGVSINSLGRWFEGSLPNSASRIKLMCYLDLLGYRVIELERMPKARRGFVELLGFGVISEQEALEITGYSSTSTMNQVLLGYQGTSEDKGQRMWDAWKERKTALEERRVAAFQRYRLGPPSKPQPATKAVREGIPLTQYLAIISIMEGLLALIDEEAIGELTEAEMVILQHGASTVHRLSVLLSTLDSHLAMAGQQKREGG